MGSNRYRFFGIVWSSLLQSSVVWEEEGPPARYVLETVNLSGILGCVDSGGNSRGAETRRPDASVYVQDFEAK
jgi:hypothetical protein